MSPRRRLALALARVASDLIDLNQLDEAIIVNREVVALFEALANGDPSSIQFQFDLADVIGNLSIIEEKAGRLDDALASVQRSIAISQAAHARNPQSRDHMFNYSTAVIQLGQVHFKRGLPSDAVREYERGLAMLAEPGVADRNPTVVAMAREGLGDALVALARRERSSARWREARQHFDGALTAWNAVKAKGALAADDAGKPEALEKKIAECDAALASR